MATKKKLLQAAAGSAGGEALNVEEVFSTYLYDGTGATQSITNGIDLDGEGGMVWIKNRDLAYAGMIYDTERGLPSLIYPNASNAADTTSGPATGTVTSFNSNGFSLGSEPSANGSGQAIVSWTFRKAPKFFTCITYSGTGTAQNISHDLDSVPGCIMVKRTDSTDNWAVYHRGVDSSAPEDWYMQLNTTDNRTDNTARWNDTAPTSTQFTVGTAGSTNASGGTYVAYLFAHNDGDGEFGPDGDADIIKCGSYTGNGSSTGTEVDLGFEPQWIMIKRSDSAAGWFLIDTMRGWTNSSGDDPFLRAESLQIEYANPYATPLATGFQLTTTNTQFNASGGNYIYIAIRRGPMAVPTDATDVFAQDNKDGDDRFDSGWPVDFTIQKNDVTAGGSSWLLSARLQGNYYLSSNNTSNESANNMRWDTQDGASYGSNVTDADDWGWMWRRAPNYFDVVAYTGSGLSNVNTISHNLGVAPDMIWVKRRDSTNDWQVYHSGLNGGTTPEQYSISLNTTGTEQDRTYWNDTAPTSTTFQVTDAINGNGDPYIAYLFASLDGVSKLGSYTGNGSSTARTIDCGFSSGARFVLIKRTDSTGNWFVFDTERGITSGDDKLLQLNKTNLEGTGQYIDPVSSGFATRTTDGDVNASGGTYIFYAIA